MSDFGTNTVRSPAYPSASLRDALGGVSKIYARYRLSSVDRVVAAKLLGYSGINGPSAKTMAALAHYGLVERAGKGEMRVTARAQSILYANSPEERLDGLREAALEPDLFRELRDRFPDFIPPSDGVETYLHRKGFNQSAIRPAAKAYLDTMLFIEEEEASESRGPAGEKPQESAVSGDLKEIMAVDQRTSSVTIGNAVALPQRFYGGGEGVLTQHVPQIPTLNKIGLNVQGHLVHVEAMLDYDGLVALEKKIAALKGIIDRIEKPEEEQVGTE